MDILNIKFWAGTEESLHGYLAAVKRMLEANVQEPEKAAYRGSGDTGGGSSDAPRLFTQQGSVGVVTIAGPINNTDSWRNEYMGAVGYPEIRAALVHAAKHPDIKTVLLDIKSGGGSVSGVTDTADLIAMIDTKVKPVHAFSDGMIASAAYWLGAAARTLDIGKVTEAGSIGVLTVHQDLSKLYADMGVTTTVMRAGKYKALGNPYEALSETAKEEIQGQLDQMYAMFAQHVADSRGVSYAVADQKMGQGRVFVGQAAVDVGLADSVTNFDALMSKLQGGIDSQKESPKYGANLQKGSQVKNALTEQEIAALALGAGAGDAPAEKTEAELTAEAAALADAEAAAEAEAAAAAAADKPVNAEVMALMHTQLAEANGKVVQLSVELAQVTAASEAALANVSLMRPVVQAAVGNLRVALGGSKDGVEAASDAALLAEHASLSQAFTNKFKVGGVAAPSSGSAGKVVEFDNPARMARINATRNNRK